MIFLFRFQREIERNESIPLHTDKGHLLSKYDDLENQFRFVHNFIDKSKCFLDVSLFFFGKTINVVPISFEYIFFSNELKKKTWSYHLWKVIIPAGVPIISIQYNTKKIRKIFMFLIWNHKRSMWWIIIFHIERKNQHDFGILIWIGIATVGQPWNVKFDNISDM